jgi:hypothetical protein
LKTGRDNLSRFAAPLVGGAIGLALLAYVVTTVRQFGRSSPPIRAVAARDVGPAGRNAAPTRLVELRPALLCDYYEHNVEHAPPRDPRGVMQKRELSYRAPAAPVAFLKSKLGAGNPADAALLEALGLWQGLWHRGEELDPSAAARLESLAAACTGDEFTLLELGRALNFLGGDVAAAGVYRAALVKAGGTEHLVPGDPAAVQLLAALDQTAALWRLKDYASLEARFRLAVRLNAPLSPESRRAQYLLAEQLYSQHRSPQAAEEIVALLASHERAGDLGKLDASDLPEMNWVAGVFFYAAERFDEAISRLEPLALDGGQRGKQAGMLVVAALAKTGRAAEARGRFRSYVARYRPEPKLVAHLVELLDEAGEGEGPTN